MNTVNQEEKRKPGRPSKVGGRDVKAYLDDESINLAKEFGNGSLSEGIRIALKYYKKHRKEAET